MLEPIGLSSTDEQVYRALLNRSPSTNGDLAKSTGLPTGQVRVALTRLGERGLVEAAGAKQGYLAVDPRVALPALVRERRTELDKVEGLVDQLHTEFRERLLRGDPAQVIEILQGSAAIAGHINVMLGSAQAQVRALDSPPYVTSPGSTTHMEQLTLERGVPCRAIYAAVVLELPDYFAELRDVAATGEQARILPTVPMKLIIADDREALLPLTSSDSGTRSSAILVRPSRLLDALVSLFELLWVSAVPIFEEASEPASGELAADELVVLKLLHTGLKDDAIARQLGISERTLRRRITDLIERLGATSRFQAGAQAARRGWV